MGSGASVYSLRCLDVSDTVQLHRRWDPHLQVSSDFAKQYSLFTMQTVAADVNILSCLASPITQNIKEQLTREPTHPNTSVAHINNFLLWHCPPSRTQPGLDWWKERDKEHKALSQSQSSPDPILTCRNLKPQDPKDEMSQCQTPQDTRQTRVSAWMCHGCFGNTSDSCTIWSRWF